MGGGPSSFARSCRCRGSYLGFLKWHLCTVRAWACTCCWNADHCSLIFFYLSMGWLIWSGFFSMLLGLACLLQKSSFLVDSNNCFNIFCSANGYYSTSSTLLVLIVSIFSSGVFVPTSCFLPDTKSTAAFIDMNLFIFSISEVL